MPRDKHPGSQGAAESRGSGADEEQRTEQRQKRQRTEKAAPLPQRASKRLKERQQAPEPAPSEPEAGGSRHLQRYGVPTPTPASALEVEGRPSPPRRGDDKDGHYNYELGDNLTKRYKILSKLGEGTFGRVLECWDRARKEYVAIKIVRNVQKYREAAFIELEVLNTLRRNDPAGLRHCIALRDWFDYRGHVCMVFEKLGPSLYDFLRKNGYKPFAADLVREFGRQLLEAVAFLHELQLVHTDLKPENVLLVTPQYEKRPPQPDSRVGRRVPLSSELRVIDFGSATYEDQYHSSVVSTRHYRAPEVVLGLGWSYACDIWSVGCILVELLVGDALFQTHENAEHLAMMERVLGPLPPSVVSRADKAAGGKYFHKGRLAWPDSGTSRSSVKAVKRMAGLRDALREQADLSCRPYLNDAVDLLHKLLAYEPEERLTAREALQHSFFTAAARTASPSRAPPPAGSRGGSASREAQGVCAAEAAKDAGAGAERGQGQGGEEDEQGGGSAAQAPAEPAKSRSKSRSPPRS